jgi:hypothetical protein
MMISNVISKNDLRQLGKRALLAALLLLALIAFGLLLNAVSASRAEKNFELAADFPRGVLVYAQFQDLPALIKQMNESPAKDRFLASVNQQQFWTRHLANKLFARWGEFNEAAGFSIDLGAFGTLADQRAAIAVYDIGKLDLMLIAPMSEAKFQACRFIQGKDQFEEVELPDGTTYYLHDVEADRGRQKQHIAFASVKGRFVLATSERLLLRAISNLNGQAKKDHLTDEPSFQALSKTVEPHFVTVWAEQSKLNDDWYFKHYWLMSGVDDLKNIRAGMFDLEMQKGRWVERREFLLNGKPVNAGAALSRRTLQTVEQIVPADVPFVELRSIGGGPNAAAELVSGALFDGKIEAPEKKSNLRWERYSDGEFEVSTPESEFPGEHRYSYLSADFDATVDEGEDGTLADEAELRFAGERRFARSLQSVLQPSHPLAAVKLARPRAIDGPLFAEFARASIITLQSPAALNRAMLERAIGELAANRLMIVEPPRTAAGRFEWKSRHEDGVEWREMGLPMLGRAVGYGIRGSELILSNNRELLTSLMTNNAGNRSRTLAPTSPVHEFTVIRLSERKAAFDQIFARLEGPLVKAYWQQRRGNSDSANGPSQEFFSGEIASLLDVASPVDEVRIQRSYVSGRLREEVAVIWGK